jgi:nucleoside-diphosphate kinase
MEHTLALIKPDTVAAGKAAEMQQLAELAGFQVVAKRTLQVSLQLVLAAGLQP